MTISEGTPLLHNQHDDSQLSEGTSIDSELIYERFSSRQKKVLLAIVSLCEIQALFVVASTYPAVPAMVKDFHSTPEVIGYAVSATLFSVSIGALMASSCSTFYGRRSIYLSSLPVLICGSLGVSLSRTVEEFFFFRVCQAIGVSPGLSVGAGVIGDIFKMEERGTAMGFFIAAILAGAAIAPVAGGIAVQYSSWRVMQLAISVMSLIALGLVWLCFPETSHPGTRGVDKLRREAESGIGVKWTRYVINPFSSLGLLRAPNILAVTLGTSTIAVTQFVLNVPLAYTIGTKYNIKNVALLGACAIPGAIGEMIGAPLSGYLSDRMVIKSRRSRDGIWYPEDRLRAALNIAVIILPLSMILSGIITTYIEGPIGLSLALVCFFMNGFGLELVLSPAFAYVVDVLHSRSAEAVAVNSGCRLILVSLATSGIMPMMDAYGMLVTNVTSAILAWLGFWVLWLTIQYGESLRAWCDIGLLTAGDN